MAELTTSISTGQIPVELSFPAQLQEARHVYDDWTGKADARERKKVQNRLHQRAWRRRKAEAVPAKSGSKADVSDNPMPEHKSVTLAFEKATAAIVQRSAERRDFASLRKIATYEEWTKQRGKLLSAETTTSNTPSTTIPSTTPLNIIDLMSVNLSSTPAAPRSLTTSPSTTLTMPFHCGKLIPPVIPSISFATSTLHFPLSPDHYLITLIQYNVFRAILTNLSLCSLLSTIPNTCTNTSLIPLIPTPSSPPPSFFPTPLQLSQPHSAWIDSIPCQRLRDNLIREQGKYDEDELCEDVCGGLYEGYDDCEARGLLVWSSPWEVGSWEISVGFGERWGWLLEGCDEMWRATDRWRERRGEDSLERMGEVDRQRDIGERR